MSEITEKLLSMKEEIEATEKKIANSQGQQEAALARLKKEWGCSSVEEGDDKIKEMEFQLVGKKQQLKDVKKELSSNYGWEDL